MDRSFALSCRDAGIRSDGVFEGSLGAAYNVGTRLRIEQEGQEPPSVNARYSTRPLESPQDYGIRLSRWDGSRAWEFSLFTTSYISAQPARASRKLADKPRL